MRARSNSASFWRAGETRLRRFSGRTRRRHPAGELEQAVCHTPDAAIAHLRRVLRRPTQPANHGRTAHMFGQAPEYARALRGRPARPITRRKKAALRRPSEHLGVYFRYRCSTRSLISCVRPWFQNCVPMYPQVRRATLSFSWSRLPQCGHSHTSLPSSSTI